MSSVPPHQYRKQATAAGVDSSTIDHALQQINEAERKGSPPILTLGHLAHQTGASYGYLRSIVSRSHAGYNPFVIKKRSGGKRLIAAPEPLLMGVQRWIAKNVLAPQTVHFSSLAYAPTQSPIGCAERHLGARWLIKLDIHDFFESISERRAYFAFRACGYQPLIAFELARICTRIHTEQVVSGRWLSNRRAEEGNISSYDDLRMGHLPQGAPTSPMLSNLVSRPLDEMLDALAQGEGLVYTRYSDDITFSTGGEISRRQIRTLIHDVSRILLSFGHILHRKKITVTPPGARKVVLGLLVDGDCVRLTRSYRSKIETHIRGIALFGLAEHAAARRFSSTWGLVRHIFGLIAHAQAVEPVYGRMMKQEFKLVLTQLGWMTAPAPAGPSDISGIADITSP